MRVLSFRPARYCPSPGCHGARSACVAASECQRTAAGRSPCGCVVRAAVARVPSATNSLPSDRIEPFWRRIRAGTTASANRPFHFRPGHHVAAVSIRRIGAPIVADVRLPATSLPHRSAVEQGLRRRSVIRPRVSRGRVVTLHSGPARGSPLRIRDDLPRGNHQT